MPFPTPRAAVVELVLFAFSVRSPGWLPPRHPVEPAERAEVEPEGEAVRPGRVRDRAAVGMIRLAGPAGLAAAVFAEEIQTLDENPGVQWALPGDTPGRIGPFNPGVRRDRSGP